MLQNYAECERRVLLSEGGYTNDPRDPGGPTNWGITLVDARLHWKPNATAEDVRAMPRSVAETIYKQKYWDALRCSELPSGVDYTVFDYGVNSGIGRAARVLRAALGLPAGTRVDDAVIAAAKNTDARRLADAINAERLQFLRHLPTWAHFGAGWDTRVSSVRAYSDHLASEAPHPAPNHVTGPNSAKAYAEDDHPAYIDPAEPKIGSVGSPLAHSDEAPATQVAQEISRTSEAPIASPSMGNSKSGWAAIGLGGSGLLTGLGQFNDYAAQLAEAKFNLGSLSFSGALAWVWAHPIVLVPIAVLAMSIFVWLDHRKYKLALYEAQCSLPPS